MFLLGPFKSRHLNVFDSQALLDCRSTSRHQLPLECTHRPTQSGTRLTTRPHELLHLVGLSELVRWLVETWLSLLTSRCAESNMHDLRQRQQPLVCGNGQRDSEDLQAQANEEHWCNVSDVKRSCRIFSIVQI